MADVASCERMEFPGLARAKVMRLIRCMSNRAPLGVEEAKVDFHYMHRGSTCVDQSADHFVSPGRHIAFDAIRAHPHNMPWRWTSKGDG